MPSRAFTWQSWFAKTAPLVKTKFCSSSATTKVIPTCCFRRRTRPGRHTTPGAAAASTRRITPPAERSPSATAGRLHNFDTSPLNYYFAEEYPMTRFLERNGFDVSYFAGIDTDRLGSEILEHKIFLSVGHDEYWSGDQRANVEAARDAGVNLAFFSGNEVFWKTRLPAATLPATPYGVMVCYKETLANAKIDPARGRLDGHLARSAICLPQPTAAAPKTRSPARCSPSTATAISARAIDVQSEFAALRFWRNTDRGYADGQPKRISRRSRAGLRMGRRPRQRLPAGRPLRPVVHDAKRCRNTF